MHMHEHLSIYLFLHVKYLPFLIFIQCTKMLYELKIHYKNKHIKQCTSLAPNSIEIQLLRLSKILMNTIKWSMQIKENPLVKRFKYTMYTNSNMPTQLRAHFVLLQSTFIGFLIDASSACSALNNIIA